MLGKNATFTCNTIGREAYWVLNAIPMTISYPNEKQAYEDQGVIFLEDISQQYYNLTMIIHASLALNKTILFCSAIGSDYTVKMSQEVHLIVFSISSKVYQEYGSDNNIVTVKLNQRVHIIIRKKSGV